ncbi:MAG: adenosylcobinamide-phosphate synthase CbiB [Eubacterium sp.]|nr:adenosylcobinamide-phosphate synthase CbiB [Eubacterium sp.]
MLLGVNTGIWFCLVILAVVLDWIVGDPRALPHPIVFIGKWVGFLTKKLNCGRGRKAKGLLLWLLTLAATVAVVLAVQYLAYKIHPVVFYLVNLYFLASTIAAKCLKQEVMKVYDALRAEDIPQGRVLVGYLVGRETSELGEGGLIRATVETTAENTIDGVMAPIFYMVLGCFLWQLHPALNPLVLAMAYKAVNTLDSMVGYIQEPYKDFGCVSAKIDDAVNFPIARLGSLLMLAGGLFLGYNTSDGWRIYRRDRKNHRSPNSANPESMVAGLLGIQLGGTNVYFGQVLEKPTIGDARRGLVYEDIKNTADIMYAGEIVMVVLIMLIFVGLYLF